MHTIKVCFVSTKETEIDDSRPYAIPVHVEDLMKLVDFPSSIVKDCTLCQFDEYGYKVPDPQPPVLREFALQQVSENRLTAIYLCKTCNTPMRIYMDNNWVCIDAVDIPLKDQSQ